MRPVRIAQRKNTYVFYVVGLPDADFIRAMRFLRRLLLKFLMLIVMVVLMGSAMRHGQKYILQAAGMPPMPQMPAMPGGTPQFSSEESDLMALVFKSALKLFSGAASREQLAGELSDKLYAGRVDAETMQQLGIELVKPGQNTMSPDGTPLASASGAPLAGPNLQQQQQPGSVPPAGQAGVVPPQGAVGAAGPMTAGARPGGPMSTTKNANGAAKPGAPAAKPGEKAAAEPVDAREAMLRQLWLRVKPFSIELTLVPVVMLGMYLVHRIRRRRAGGDEFALPMMPDQMPADTEPYDMEHDVHSLKSEDFELLVALVHQRQGYRVSMPAGLSGGRGGDFLLQRKSERVLVQCKRLPQEHRIPVERVRELQEAVTTAGATRGMFVASCGFTWDARNFAKTKGLMLVNARTLDAQLKEARETPKENLLEITAWAPKFMSKVKLTPPTCPACEASMDEVTVSSGTVWVCSQRPDCKGRRPARKTFKIAAAPASAGIAVEAEAA